MVAQPPMLSVPLKQTTEVDLINPLKGFIQNAYGLDPNAHSKECALLHKLRQDMRGAGEHVSTGRDLLYRYYQQLELLDCRFPIDENHIKILFTWYDAFTKKATSQYSLAYEKASVIFNIGAALSCCGSNQDLQDEAGLKLAYHSFQAAAGSFQHINENFLHAPSDDLSRETLKTLTTLMLAQSQEIVLQKSIDGDGENHPKLAKLASQCEYLYLQATEGLQQCLNNAVLPDNWLYFVQSKTALATSIAHYHQALNDNQSSLHGLAVARLRLSKDKATQSLKAAKSTSSSSNNFGTTLANSDFKPSLVKLATAQQAAAQSKFNEFEKDNDYIHHEREVSESEIPEIRKLPVAKLIPLADLYQGEDVRQIVGPDIFRKIVPLKVTEMSSTHDEEKAKLLRSESEVVSNADDELSLKLSELNLPEGLEVLKGNTDTADLSHADPQLREWCEIIAERTPLGHEFEQLHADNTALLRLLDTLSEQLTMEESACEKKRIQFGADWTQQPSSMFTESLRGDVRNMRNTVNQATTADNQIQATYRQNEAIIREMYDAGDNCTYDALFDRAMQAVQTSQNVVRPTQGSLLDDDDAEDAEESGASVSAKIASIQDTLNKLDIVKRDRQMVLKDLRMKVHENDISELLVLNIKTLKTDQDWSVISKSELEKFRHHRTRITQANYTQVSLLTQLASEYSNLANDKRVRSEQAERQATLRQRNAALNRYRKAYNAYREVLSGLDRAKEFYSETRLQVQNIGYNVDSFVENRNSERDKISGELEEQTARRQYQQHVMGEQAQRERMNGMMHRLSIGSPIQQPQQQQAETPPPLPPHPPQSSFYAVQSHQNQPPVAPYPHPHAYPPPPPPPPKQQPPPRGPPGYPSASDPWTGLGSW